MREGLILWNGKDGLLALRICDLVDKEIEWGGRKREARRRERRRKMRRYMYIPAEFGDIFG